MKNKDETIFSSKRVQIVIHSGYFGEVIFSIFRKRGVLLFQSIANSSDELYESIRSVSYVLGSISKVANRWFLREVNRSYED